MIGVASGGAFAAPQPPTLQDLQTVAKDVCAKPEQYGYKRGVNGALTGKLSGPKVIAKFLDLGASANIAGKTSDWKGIPQADMASSLADYRHCSQTTFLSMFNNFYAADVSRSPQKKVPATVTAPTLVGPSPPASVQATGVLIAGNLRTPRPCSAKPGVALGSNFIGFSEFPANVVLLDNEPILQIDRVQGVLKINQARIFDTEDRVIVGIHDNSYWVSPGYRLERHGQFGIKIYDKEENTILKIGLLNKDMISVEGIFRHHGQVIIVTDKIHLWKNTFSDDCFEDSTLYMSREQSGTKSSHVE